MHDTGHISVMLIITFKISGYLAGDSAQIKNYCDKGDCILTNQLNSFR